MSDFAPRCPFCANVLKIQPSFWEKIGLKSNKTHCPSCQRTCEARDANTMGSAYWHWADVFRKELVEALEPLPILSDPAMMRALGMPHKDDMRLIPSLEELVRTRLRFHRPVVIEMARGREATLEVVHLKNESTQGVEVLAILGTSAAESGGKESEQVVARRGATHFVVFNHPGKTGAEPRVKQAVHQKEKKPRSLTDAHVVAMHASRVPLTKHAHHA